MYGMEKCEAFYTSLKLLTYTNTIPYKNKKLQFAILYAATRLMCLITFIALPGVHVMKTITGKTGVDLSEDLSTMLGVTECILVTTLFISSYDKWSEFLTDLEHCNNFATPKAFDNTINKLNLYSLLYGSYSIVGCLIYAVIAIMKTPRCKKFNEEHNLNEICGSFTVLVLPFDFNNVSLVVRSVIFFVHMILGMFTLVTASVTIFVTYESAVILSCHFGELKKYLKEVFETESIEEQKQRLGFCIRYHNNILNLCMRRSHIVRYTHGIPLLSIPIILACIGNMLLNVRKTGVDLSEDLSTMIGGTGCILITMALIISYEEWIRFLIDLEDCKKYATPKDFDKTRIKLNLYSTLYGLYPLLGCLIYAIISIMGTSRCKKFNEENNLNETCGSFTVLVLPFDFNNASLVIRAVIFFVHMVLALLTLVPAGVVIFVSYESAAILSCHIGELKKYLQQVLQTESKEEQRERLRFCIRYHKNILNLCKRRSRLGKYTYGIPLLSIPLIIACIGNTIPNSKIQGLFFLSGYIVGLFLVCHGGQLIIDETLSVSDALYELNWYEADVNIAKDILFMVNRAQKPATSDGILIGAVNYPLFLLALKTSYSYIIFLRQSV
ncbi:hypothetical protein NQ315_005544 [Exocentrus adspersus]|uniref:Odorant receptor n=1 Tax=Exocentrus adspersus TaxID=1586481 RepID=A0AAV8VUA8_9CUCU|nr:hypothetical protein NQ315_005544 [Exocentrus adspersus]